MQCTVYRIKSIEDYGKLISFCIDRDISVFRTFWDEAQKDERCYFINWVDKRCYYSTEDYFTREGYIVVDPVFHLDPYGHSFCLEVK